MKGMATDPVCGMTVDESTAKWSSEYQGKTFYFCSQMCKETFDDDPKMFLRGMESSET